MSNQVDVLKQIELINSQELSAEEMLDSIVDIAGEDEEVPSISNVDVFYKHFMTKKDALGIREALRVSKEATDKFVSSTGITGDVTEEDDDGVQVVKKAPKKKREDSKKVKAVKIFKEHYGKIAPKDVQQMFKDQLDMTTLGARTYYYTIKGELGLSKKKGS